MYPSVLFFFCFCDEQEDKQRFEAFPSLFMENLCSFSPRIVIGSKSKIIDKCSAKIVYRNMGLLGPVRQLGPVRKYERSDVYYTVGRSKNHILHMSFLIKCSNFQIRKF